MINNIAEMEINKIYNENCLDTMNRMPDNFIDLTVTSPPYDNMREYKGYTFDFESIAKELYRVTKDGGVIVWVVGDATINGSETGTSFRQALFFMECGFRLETMVWEKTGNGCLGSNMYYNQSFEYMFVLCKNKAKSINFIYDRENVIKTGLAKVNSSIDKTGNSKIKRCIYRKPFGKRNNIWRFDTQKNSDHPAPFPEHLAADHIYSWSNEGDLVYDPFTGSGTTLKMAHLQKRNWIGSEISSEYTELANKRISHYLTIKTLF